MIKLRRDRLHVVGLVGIALIGVVLRLRQYTNARSLWLDEVSLAENFAGLGFPDIVLETLLRRQSAPPGYLLATQTAVRVFGTSEQALRLTALLAGLATLGLATFVACRLLRHPLAQAVFVALVSFSPSLIYYSNELKQYSSDVLAIMAVLALWAVRNDRRAIWWWIIGGALIAVSSLTGIIGLIGLGTAAALEQYQRQRPHGDDSHANAADERPTVWTRRSWVQLMAAWTTAVGLHGLYTLRAGTDREYMKGYWGDAGAFPPEGIGSIAELEWYPLALMRLVWVGIGESSRVGPQGVTGPLLVALIALGLVLLALRHRRDLRALFGIILGLAWVLAELRIYPTSGRLSLYLIPLILLLVAAGFESVFESGNVTTRLVSGAGVAVLLFAQSSIAVSEFMDPLDDRDMRWLVAEIASRSEPGDVLLADSRTRTILDWYVARESGWSLPVIGGTGRGLPDDVRPNRIWIPSTHVVPRAKQLAERVIGSGYALVCADDVDYTYLALLVRDDLAASLDPETVCAFTTER